MNELHEAGKKIAFHLGNGWKFSKIDSYDHSAILINGRKQIFIRVEKRKYSICGFIKDHPQYQSIRDRTGYIGASMTKTALTIANDIKRRILDDLEKCYIKRLDDEAKFFAWKEIHDAKIELIRRSSKEGVYRTHDRLYLKVGKGISIRCNITDYVGREEGCTVNIEETSGLSFDKFLQVLNLLNSD